MKVSQKLILTFSLLTVIVLVLGIVALQTFHKMNGEMTVLNDNVVPSTISRLEMVATLATLEIEVAQFVITGDSEHRKHAQDSIAQIQNKMNEHTTHSNHLKYKVIPGVVVRVKEMIDLARQVIQLKESGDTEAKFEASQRQMYQKRKELTATFVEHIDKHRNELKISHDRMRYVYEKSEVYVWVAIISAFLLLVGVGFRMSIAISNAINYAVEIVMSATKGNFSEQILKKYIKNQHDEIGYLFQALTQMNNSLETYITTITQQKNEALRIKTGLDNMNTSVLMADNSHQIIYANQAAYQLFSNRQVTMRKQLPQFDIECLLDYSIDDFHNDPAQFHQLLEEITAIYSTTLEIDGVSIDIRINLIINAERQRLGWVAEFYDCTAEVALEQEINAVILAALQGDFSQRVDSTNKTRFFHTFSETLNQTLDSFKDMLEELMCVFAAIAKGDLTQTITKNYAGSLEQLKNDVNTTVVELTRMREAIQQTAEAASQGNFSQRIDLTDKAGFFKSLSERLNQMFDSNQQIIEELMHVFAAINHGDLTKTITKDYAGSLKQLKNEVNATIAKLTSMMNEIQIAATAASQGDFNKYINLTEQSGFFATLSHSLNQILKANQQLIGELQRVFAAMANGYLTQTLSQNYVGSLAQLKNDVDTTVIKLTRMVNTVKQTVEVINQVAEEISQDNTNLSQRTEEQAASLEQTVASMEQMTSTVQQNADNAQQANQLAANARNHAQKGGEVVGAAIAAMTDISYSSDKVADIIGVIDEIAFQTNLLALNAAVEAARAGEHGRGFAVVASEVRHLAQRSAAAAKEIKGLIKDGIGKVEEGTGLVNQSGQTLRDIVVAAKKVNDIIVEIAAASQEQSAGINQINKAIAQMDGMTQQNASLVGKASTSGESMKKQVQILKEQVAFFKTAGKVMVSEEPTITSKPSFSEPTQAKTQPIFNQTISLDEEWKEF